MSLFRLLDADGNGEVDIEEFCEGCLRLKGDAKSFDIHCLMYENQRMLGMWKEFMSFVEEHLDVPADTNGPAAGQADRGNRSPPLSDTKGSMHSLGCVDDTLSDSPS